VGVFGGVLRHLALRGSWVCRRVARRRWVGRRSAARRPVINRGSSRRARGPAGRARHGWISS